LASSVYPEMKLQRDQWILGRRGPRNAVDRRRPYAFFVEEERDPDGHVVPVATVFLSNRECPWRCVMCDLWRNTLTTRVEPGDIPAQIDFALSRLAATKVLKLYNSGSFFDSGAIPSEDHAAIAERANRFERVIVESHPALVDERCRAFRHRLTGKLEVAMGLETAHRQVLERLNKRMTLEQFSGAAEFLAKNEIALRVFTLVQPPFMKAGEAAYWAQRSLEFAFECGATAATLIPTRTGNGAMEALAEFGEFLPPTLELLEAAMEYGLRLKRGRVFVDLWDIERVADCSACFSQRVERLREMNRSQAVTPVIRCSHCS
jgi:archaeosine synthase beta-subunit